MADFAPAGDFLKGLPNKTLYKGKLVIFTPFYKAQAHARYTQSLVATAQVLERLGIKWEYKPECGDFHVERALNGALALFMADPEATDFLNIDSDEAWHPEAVLRLILHPHDVVGCAYRMRNRWEKFNVTPQFEDGKVMGYVAPDGKTMLRVDKIPAGFLRIRKPALEKWVAAYPDEWYMDGEVKVPRFFWLDVHDGRMQSQDWAFSRKMIAAGVELWCDPNPRISHFGDTEYAGSLDEALRSPKREAA